MTPADSRAANSPARLYCELEAGHAVLRFARNKAASAFIEPDWTQAMTLEWEGEFPQQMDPVSRACLSRWLMDAATHEVAIRWDSMPSSLHKLHQLRLGLNRKALASDATKRTLLAALGAWSIGQWQAACEVLSFTGEWTLSVARWLRGRAHFPRHEFLAIVRATSSQALPIVSLISFLVGLIISFLGAVVLKRFGAEFAVAYLIGFGMLREMGALMTGIIIAGRTGAAYAAQIGSMQVNEEIDALRTFGISPMDYLVLPRVLALLLVMPLLTIYANVVGIFGGYLVAEVLMGVPASIFFAEMASVVGASDFILGVIKAVVFGFLVGTSGCLRGLQCGSGSNAVGVAATRAVVTGITLIIIANALIDWAVASIDF